MIGEFETDDVPEWQSTKEVIALVTTCMVNQFQEDCGELLTLDTSEMMNDKTTRNNVKKSKQQ